MQTKKSAQETVYAIETTASKAQLKFRYQLLELFNKAPIKGEELLFNLGLYIRSSLLVKFIVMNDIYRRVKHIPGVMMEFGVWYGQNLVLLENLRAIHEPFNKQRRFIGFDTFEGYEGKSKSDKDSAVWMKESYSSDINYVEYIQELLKIHEGCNILGHLRGNHQLVIGDAAKTVPDFFNKYPETLVAFSFFDMGLYKPTKIALECVLQHSMPGSLILLDELTWAESPGEAIAFKEVFKDHKYRIEKIDLYPSKTLVTIL